MHTCATQRPRRPQLSDTINRLDEMLDGLSTAIPGAVAESVREVLGSSLVAALRDAVRDAVKEGVKEALQAGVAEALAKAASDAVPATSRATSAPAAPSRMGAQFRLSAMIGRVGRWLGRRAAPVVARVALGWAIVKIVGGATIRSRSAALATALVGAAAGCTGYVAGPVGSAVLLGLAGGAITATAAWAAPTVCLLVALREEQVA